MGVENSRLLLQDEESRLQNGKSRNAEIQRMRRRILRQQRALKMKDDESMELKAKLTSIEADKSDIQGNIESYSIRDLLKGDSHLLELLSNSQDKLYNILGRLRSLEHHNPVASCGLQSIGHDHGDSTCPQSPESPMPLSPESPYGGVESPGYTSSDTMELPPELDVSGQVRMGRKRGWDMIGFTSSSSDEEFEIATEENEN